MKSLNLPSFFQSPVKYCLLLLAIAMAASFFASCSADELPETQPQTVTAKDNPLVKRDSLISIDPVIPIVPLEPTDPNNTPSAIDPPIIPPRPPKP